MPIIDLAHSSLLTANAIHSKQVHQGSARHEILDWSALVAGSRVAAGLPGFDGNASVRDPGECEGFRNTEILLANNCIESGLTA